MANTLVNMVLKVRLEEKTAFDGTGTAYVKKWQSEDKAKTQWEILAAGAPGSNFDDAPLDSLYFDTTNHILYIKTASDTWTKVGAQT